MLQRAAGNAYSWWSVSRIRTKQSKWLEENLKDMDEKVAFVLKILEEDADSFAKRAEMYYKKKPELINFVEETYKAYRSLAERYEHISKELQHANNTIANVFPEEVRFEMEEEDEKAVRKTECPSDVVPKNVPKDLPTVPKLNLDIPKKEKKPKLLQKETHVKENSMASMSSEEALEEIDKLQKGILVLQTGKEFVKSSYESIFAKYWEIETQITEMQERVCNLQDEFDVAAVIEDDEARALMAATALTSCKDTIALLEKQQKRLTEEARTELDQVKSVEEKLKALKGESLSNLKMNEKNTDKETVSASSTRNLEADVNNLKHERPDLKFICNKVKEYFEMSSNTALSVTELAENINELVNKVHRLETVVSSQTALIKRLRSETANIQTHLQTVEEDKVTPTDYSNNMTKAIKDMEEELHRIQDLSLLIKDQNNQISTNYAEACQNLDDIFKKLQMPTHKGENEISGSLEEEESQDINIISTDVELHESDRKDEMTVTLKHNSTNAKDMIVGAKKDQKESAVEMHRTHNFNPSVEENRAQFEEPLLDAGQQKQEQEEINVKNSLQAEESETVSSDMNPQEPIMEQEGSVWQRLILSGLENSEKILCTEYTSIIQKYKETNGWQSDREKNQELLFETMAQVSELKSSNVIKDLEIQSLRQKLNILQTSTEESYSNLTNIKSSHYSRVGSKLDESKSSVSDLSTDCSKQTSPNTQTICSMESTEKSSEVRAEEIKVPLIDEPNSLSSGKQKFQRGIHKILDDNLEFWLRFNTSFHQIQTFQTATQELKAEVMKLKENEKENEKQATSSTDLPSPDKNPEVSPLEKTLRELKTELSGWLEQNVLLKEELPLRISSLSKIQEEISRVSKMSSDNKQADFIASQAGKYQGEALNIQEENNKAAQELQTGLDHVRKLQLEVEKTLSSLNENPKSSSSSHRHPSHNHLSGAPSMRQNKVPLKSFLFGDKPKKSKPSIFSFVNLVLQKHHSDRKAARRLPM